MTTKEKFAVNEIIRDLEAAVELDNLHEFVLTEAAERLRALTGNEK